MHYFSLLKFFALVHKLLFAAGLLLLGLGSCKKPDDNNSVYLLTGVRDLVLERNPFDKGFDTLSAVLPFGVKYEKGNPTRILFSVEGLPAGLTDSFRIKSGYPDFENTLFLKNKGAAAGSYNPAVVLLTETGSVVARSPFKITINGFGTCAEYFAGREFTAASDCPIETPDKVSFISRSTLLSAGSDTVLLNNYKNEGFPLKVVFNCQKHTIEIPLQQVGDRTLGGLGEGVPFGDLSDSPSKLSFVIYETLPNTTSICVLNYTFK